MQLHYLLERAANGDNVSVTLEIQNLRDRDELVLLLSEGDLRDCVVKKGNKVLDSTIEDNKVTVKKPPSSFQITYTARIGEVGKHGKSGYAEDQIVIASGAQLFLLPLDASQIDDGLVKKAISSISYTVSEEFAPCISAPPDRLTELSWDTVYQLTKSSFVFGYFETREYTNEFGTLYIDYQPEHKTLLDGIEKLFDAYCDLFRNAPENLRVCLLNTSSVSEHIFGGAGGYTIGATFVTDNERDWELLSHRMFHAFFDANCPTYITHTEPNVWLTEGLATYYESVCLETAIGSPKAKETFSKLLTRYQYIREKDSELSALVPAEEARLTDPSAIEFLHYTQAPLTVYAAEQSLSTENSLLNAFLREAQKFAKNGETQGDEAVDIVTDTLCSAGVEQEFIDRYVAKGEPLPLTETLPDNAETQNMLQQFETDLYAWKNGPSKGNLD